MGRFQVSDRAVDLYLDVFMRIFRRRGQSALTTWLQRDDGGVSRPLYRAPAFDQQRLKAKRIAADMIQLEVVTEADGLS